MGAASDQGVGESIAPPLWYGVRPRFVIAGVVFLGTCVGLVAGSSLLMPRVLGDELIYWDISRSLAFAAEFRLRGEVYGVAPLYPAVIALVQLVAPTPVVAYWLARGVGALAFSSSAVPMYFIARRVVPPRRVVLICLLTVLMPSLIYTSTIMTENLFYPCFLWGVLAAVRALERPSRQRELEFAGVVLVACAIRVQGLALIPMYLLAGSILVPRSLEPGHTNRRRAVAVAMWLKGPFWALVSAGLVAVLLQVARGKRPDALLGIYRYLLRSYNVAEVGQWFIFNLADVELFCGFIPVAALIVLTSRLWSRDQSLSDAAAVQVAVALAAVVTMLFIVAVFSAAPAALERVHERNLFYVLPLILLSFFVWLEIGLPRPRTTVSRVAVAIATVAPATLGTDLVSKAGTDAIALIPWAVVGLAQPAQSAALFGTGVVSAVLFLRLPKKQARALFPAMVAVIYAVLFVFALGSVLRQQQSFGYTGSASRPTSWIDDAVGRNADVAAVWVSSDYAASSEADRAMHDFWNVEFFNRSVRAVAALGEPLPDGLPYIKLYRQDGGCVLPASRRAPPTYVVVAPRVSVASQPVAHNSQTGLRLYRVPRGAASCWLRIKVRA